MKDLEKYKNANTTELFDIPERMVVVGATNVGKTCFVNKIILKYQHKFTDIILCGVFKSELENHPGIKDKLKIHHEDTLYNPFNDFDIAENKSLSERHVLLFYDDSMSTFLNSKMGADIFYKGRHWNLSIVVCLQNYFYKGSESQTIRANMTHLTLFKIRSLQQIATLARGLESGKDRVQKFINIYNKYVINKKYGYITIFLDNDDLTRYRTDIVNETGVYDTIISFV